MVQVGPGDGLNWIGDALVHIMERAGQGTGWFAHGLTLVPMESVSLRLYSDAYPYITNHQTYMHDTHMHTDGVNIFEIFLHLPVLK